jgi:hypothetical protein
MAGIAPGRAGDALEGRGKSSFPGRRPDIIKSARLQRRGTQPGSSGAGWKRLWTVIASLVGQIVNIDVHTDEVADLHKGAAQ